MWLKLTGLIVKQVSKPFTNILKAEAKKYPRFSEFCIYIGQTAHYMGSRINVFTSGYKFVGVKPLAEEVALSDGITYFSEFLLFSIAGGIIVTEYIKGEKKNTLKSEKAAAHEAMVQKKLEERFIAIESKLDRLASAVEEKNSNSRQSHNNVDPPPASTFFWWWKK
jgi:optic atrophy 3 protein